MAESDQHKIARSANRIALFSAVFTSVASVASVVGLVLIKQSLEEARSTNEEANRAWVEFSNPSFERAFDKNSVSFDLTNTGRDPATNTIVSGIFSYTLPISSYPTIRPPGFNYFRSRASVARGTIFPGDPLHSIVVLSSKDIRNIDRAKFDGGRLAIVVTADVVYRTFRKPRLTEFCVYVWRNVQIGENRVQRCSEHNDAI